jgi:hypothetical protein
VVTTNADFDHWVARFQNFLTANGYSPMVMWVSSQDVLLTGTKQVFVRIPLAADNEAHVRADFDRGTQQKLGVAFRTFCKMDNATCCYTWVPRDEEEAQYGLMPQDVKLSVTAGEGVLFGRPVRSRFKWLWLRLKHRKHQERKAWLFS